MSKVRLQGPENCGGFSHSGIAYQADEDGVIEIPVGEAVTAAYSHGFKHITAKAAPKPLAKAAKGGEPDVGDEGELKKAEEVKPAQKGAKAAKGGAE